MPVFKVFYQENAKEILECYREIQKYDKGCPISYAKMKVQPEKLRYFMGKEKHCQSCGMPIDKETPYGTNADGSENKDYCQYCFQKGAFTDDRRCV